MSTFDIIKLWKIFQSAFYSLILFDFNNEIKIIFKTILSLKSKCYVISMLLLSVEKTAGTHLKRCRKNSAITRNYLGCSWIWGIR